MADLGILTFVVATMTALGMRLTISQIMGPLRGWILPIKALVANFVLVPAVALPIRAVFPLSDGFGIGLILMATAAGFFCRRSCRSPKVRLPRAWACSCC